MKHHRQQKTSIYYYFGMENRMNRMNRLIFMLNNNYVALFYMDGNEFTTSFLSRFKNELHHQKEWIEMRK